MWCGSGTIIHIHVDSDPFRFAGSCPACYHFINIHVLSGPFRFAGSWQAYYHFVDSCDQWSIIVSCDPATSVPLFFPYVVLSARVSTLRLFFHFRSRHEFVISPAFVAATSMFLRFMFFQSFGRWLYGQLRHAFANLRLRFFPIVLLFQFYFVWFISQCYHVRCTLMMGGE